MKKRYIAIGISLIFLATTMIHQEKAMGQKSYGEREKSVGMKHIRELLCKEKEPTIMKKIYYKVCKDYSDYAIVPSVVGLESWMLHSDVAFGKDSAMEMEGKVPLEPWMMNPETAYETLGMESARSDAEENIALESWMLTPQSMKSPEQIYLENWMTTVFDVIWLANLK